MSAFLDSSVLIKRYVRERGSARVHRMFDAGGPLLVSAIVLAECLAVLARKRFDGTLTARAHRLAREALVAEWAGLTVIALGDPVQQRVAELLDRVPLRGMDAIHLASALWIRDRVDSDLAFVCSDRRLADAAAGEQLRIVDPEGR